MSSLYRMSSFLSDHWPGGGSGEVSTSSVPSTFALFSFFHFIRLKKKKKCYVFLNKKRSVELANYLATLILFLFCVFMIRNFHITSQVQKAKCKFMHQTEHYMNLLWRCQYIYEVPIDMYSFLSYNNDRQIKSFRLLKWYYFQ